jgi:subtilisin family serine protease
MRKSERNAPSAGNGPARGRTNGPAGPGDPVPLEGGLTGRYIVLLREGTAERAAATLQNRTGVRMQAMTADAGDGADALGTGDGVVFGEIGAAVLSVDPDQLQSMQALSVAGEGAAPVIEAVEPERYVFALAELESRRRTGARYRAAVTPPPDTAPPAPDVEVPAYAPEYTPEYTPESDASRLADLVEATAPAEGVGEVAPRELADAAVHYLQGYRDAANTLIDHLLERAGAETVAAPAAQLLTWSESVNTWGLQATRVASSTRTGRGVRVAVLDTGFGPHPDFAGRTMHLASFVSGQTAADGHGHGTHCIGTACGPRTPRHARHPRYGIAYESEIFAGKVLSDAGSGTDAGILAGINWAVANGCRVISMSLGAPVAVGQPFSAVYEGVAQRALQRGTLIVAAAGNNRPNPVNHPANCPSILAVAALDDQLRPASFSARGVNPNGGAVDIAAPGVNVYSSWPLAPMYRRLNGTSMATPHVAGIAALCVQATGLTGAALWRRLVADARALAYARADVGAGLARSR